VPVDAQALWAEKYAARFASAKQAEDEAREQAFVDDTFIVYGERLRGMTPRDLLHLQVVQSPIIYGHSEIKPADLMLFLWALNVENKGWFRSIKRSRMIKRVLGRRSEDPVADAIVAISGYIATMFTDAPGGSSIDESKPFGACWLAPVMVRLSSKIGSIDPLNGTAWADVPMPRIWQYLKAVRASEDSKFKDFSPSDKILSDWQAEVNALS
jgi:hypothetical protein